MEQERKIFKGIVRHIVGNTDDPLLQASFRANKQDGHNRLGKCGIRRHQPDVRISPVVEPWLREKVVKAIALLRTKDAAAFNRAIGKESQEIRVFKWANLNPKQEPTWTRMPVPSSRHGERIRQGKGEGQPADSNIQQG